MILSLFNAFKENYYCEENINFGKFLVVMLCVIVISQGLSINQCYADPVTKTMTINFTEDMNQSKSKTITIPNLKSIVDVSINTGNVSHSVDGENITFSVSGGSPSRQEYNAKKYSKQVTDSKIQGSSSFSSTMDYNYGTYSGTLYKTGTSVFLGGSQGESSYTTKYHYIEWNSYWKWDDDDRDWIKVSSTSPSLPDRIYYSNDGFTGWLSLKDTDYVGGSLYDWKLGPNWTGRKGETKHFSLNRKGKYGGPIYKSDTRSWKQNYSGTVYKGGYDDYYGYTVTLKYTDNSNPTIGINKPTENEYFSKKVGHNSISIEGNVKDDDAGDNLTVYYSILDRSNNPVLGHENINIDSFLANGNTQNFSNYTISVDDSLSEGNNNIKIWCEDDKGGKSNEITRSFIVDNTGPTSNVPTVRVISNTEIQITPNANDPSNLNVAPFLYNRDDSDITSWIDTSPYSDTGLVANTQYTYKYKAKDSLDNESRYSPIAKIYTKALNPENISISDSVGTSITFEIANAPQGQPPEHKLELKLKGAGENGSNISTSDWSADTTRELTGLTIETEYELWVMTRNCDGVENPKYLALDSFITNTSPTVSITTIEEQNAINYDGSFILEGTITDTEGDTVTIKGVLGGITKSTSIDTSANSHWSLSWTGTELNSGQFEGINITANDGKSGTANTKWNGSIVINPYVELNGAKLIETERESTFIDPGATSNYAVKVLGSVDTSKLGEYILTYEAENPLGTKASKTRTVVVVKNLKDRIRDKITEINKKLDDLKNTKEIDLPTGIDDLNKSIDELENQISSLPDGKEKDDFIKELEDIKAERDKILKKVSDKAYFEDQINKIHIDFDNDPVILVLPNLDKGEYRLSVIDLEDNSNVISNTTSTGGNIEISGAKMGHTYRIIIEIYYKDILYSRTIFDSTYPDTIAPIITGIYRLKGEVYVLGMDNYKLAIKPYGFKFKEGSYVEKELTSTDGIKAVGRMYLDVDDTKYYKDNHIAINAPNTLKILLKDSFNNTTEKEITVNDYDEIIYGEVSDEIKDSIYGKKHNNNNSNDEDIVITDPNIDEELKEDIIDTINDTDIKSEDTELNSNEGKISINISNKLKNKYIGDDYRYRLDIIKKDNMNLVYTKILNEPENVEIPKLQDSTKYIVRLSILKGNKELAFKEIEKMTKDRTAPIIESIVIRNNRINVIAKDNVKLHSKAYKFDITGKKQAAMKEKFVLGEGVLVASIDDALDISLLASKTKWAEVNWQNENRKEFDTGTKLIVTVRDKEGNFTQSNEIIADGNGIIHETINPENPLKVGKGSQIDVEDILDKIIDKLGKYVEKKDLDIKITQGNATIKDGKINIIGKGDIVVSITNTATNKTIQYLIKVVDDNDSFKRRIIVEKGSQMNVALAFDEALIDIFENTKNITFETTSSNISINDYVLKAHENGIGTIIASKDKENIKLYVIVADSISSVRSNIQKIEENVAFTILKGKEINVKDYLELEGQNVNSKYLVIETDSKNIKLIDDVKVKALNEGIATIRVVDLAEAKVSNINFKVVDIKPFDQKLTDIEKHWAKETVENAILKGIVHGYEDNTFRPDEIVSTEEFLVMLNKVKLITNKEDKKLNSIDLSRSHWSYYEIANATMGLKADEIDFILDTPLTREKAVYLTTKILEFESDSQVKFTDIDNSKYKESIKTAGRILKGYEDGSFKGSKEITRAEAVTLIKRILLECGD
ncbi:MAG: S-layer homology domain-containing protein [Maledivibacter sp.]|nr:S-layer homology domain-containing protein [Maledivibacter sp.]